LFPFYSYKLQQHSRANDCLPEEQNDRMKERSEIVVTIYISSRQRSYTAEHLHNQHSSTEIKPRRTCAEHAITRF